MRTLVPYLEDTPERGHRAARWTSLVSVGRFWNQRRDTVVESGDTVVNVLTQGAYAFEYDRGHGRVAPGSAVFFRRGATYAPRPVQPSRTGLYVRLHPDLWEALHPDLGGDPDVRQLTPGPAQLLSLHALLRASPGWEEEDFVEEAVAWAEAVLRTVPIAPRQPVEPAVEATWRYVVAHPAENAGQDALAARIGLTRWQLLRRFRQQTGHTVFRLRERVRMGIALARVHRGQDLTELALELGYTSHAHFTERFRRFYGAPPRTVRRRSGGPARIR